MSIKTAVEANGWTLVEAMQCSAPGEFVVISKRPSSPFGEDRVYVTHKYYEVNGGLHHGHYDMTLAEAVESMEKRSY